MLLGQPKTGEGEQYEGKYKSPAEVERLGNRMKREQKRRGSRRLRGQPGDGGPPVRGSWEGGNARARRGRGEATAAREKKRKTGERRRRQERGSTAPGAEAALPEEERPGKNEGVLGRFPRPPAAWSLASRSSPPLLREQETQGGATAGRRICFQPRSLTWRPTSCQQRLLRSPAGRVEETPLAFPPCLPCPPPTLPTGGRAAGGQRPRSIERGRLERRHRGQTTIESEFRHRLDGPLAAVHSQSSGVCAVRANGSDGKGKTERSACRHSVECLLPPA